jgi:hypothetical protein
MVFVKYAKYLCVINDSTTPFVAHGELLNDNKPHSGCFVNGRIIYSDVDYSLFLLERLIVNAITNHMILVYSSPTYSSDEHRVEAC